MDRNYVKWSNSSWSNVISTNVKHDCSLLLSKLWTSEHIARNGIRYCNIWVSLSFGIFILDLLEVVKWQKKYNKESPGLQTLAIYSSSTPEVFLEKNYFQKIFSFPLWHLWWAAFVYKKSFIWIFMQVNFSWIDIID